MATLEITIALGIAICVFSYLAFAWKSENNGTTAVWKVFSMIVLMLLLVLLAWSTTSANKVCDVVATNSTVVANVTSTNYALQCFTGPATQGTMFLKLMLLVTVIFFIWISVALFISSVEYLRSTGKY